MKRVKELQMLSYILSRKKINALNPRLYYSFGIGESNKVDLTTENKKVIK